MAIERTIKIVAETKQADIGIKELFDTMLAREIEVQKKIEELNEEIERISDASKKASKGVGGIGASFKGLGLAIKAAGIGLILSAFALLKELFTQNQKVADFFSTTMGTLSIVFNDLFSYVFDAAPKVIGFFKDIFENPVESIEKLGNAIAENITERFNSLLELLSLVGNAFVALFKGEFSKAADLAKQAGKEYIDVITGVDDSFDKAADAVSNLANKTKDYITNAYDQSKALVELSKSAELAEASIAGLIEKYDRSAEKQRQLRDDTTKSIADRIKANEELGKVLDDQEEQMLKLANIQIDRANAQLKINDNTENNVALINALAEKEGVLATIEGFRSEQLINKIGLQKEEIDLNNSISKSEKDRMLSQLAFEESLQLTQNGRLEKERERLNLENELIKEDLEVKRGLYAEGTQTRVDAEIAYLDRKAAIDNALLLNEIKSNEGRLNNEIILEDAKKKIQMQSVNNIASTFKLIESLDEGNKALKAASVIADSAVGISSIITNTQAANSAAILKYALIPSGSALAAREILANKISAGIGIATTTAAMAKALSALGTGGGIGGSSEYGSNDSSATQAPSFNIVAGTGSNQIADSINSTKNPIKTYVVSGDVTSSQEFDRKIIDSARI